MASPALSFPFSPSTHWSASISSSVTVSRYLQNHLVIGLASGEIILYHVDFTSDSPTLSVRGRLTGHTDSVIALELLTTVSETSSATPLLLSLSADGSLSKWAFDDCRCLQSARNIIPASARPRGMVVAQNTGLGENWLTNSAVLVYGCNSEVIVLNAESLETVLLWTGHVDWPLPAVSRMGQQNSGCDVVTITPLGEVQSWTLMGNRGGRDPAVLKAEKDYTRRTAIRRKEKWGTVMSFERADGGYVVVQSSGLGFYTLGGADKFELLLQNDVEISEGILGVELNEDGKVVSVRTGTGVVKVFKIRGGKLEQVAHLARPSSLEKSRIVNVSTVLNSSTLQGQAMVFHTSQRNVKLPPTDLSIAQFSINEGGETGNVSWTDKVLLKTDESNEKSSPSTSSAVFANMLVIAHGAILKLFSLTAFLLSYHEPTMTLELQCGSSKISYLKQIRIGGTTSMKEYLIAGATSGEVFIIDAPSFKPSKRLPLFSSAVVSAHLLPDDLGRRIRSSLLVGSLDGSSAIVDVERARMMVTFPSHDSCSLTAFGTKALRNCLQLTYEDEVVREWDMGEEDGGVLLNLPPSRGSEERTENDGEEWRIIDLQTTKSTSGNAGGVMVDCRKLCAAGLPAASVNVRIVLSALETATNAAMETPRESERRVIGSHPALVNAQSLLTALIPGGSRQLIPPEEGEDDKDWRQALDKLFFRRKKPAVMGQIGASGRISMLSPQMVQNELSPTVTAIVLLTALTLISALLEATGKQDIINIVVEKTICAYLGKRQVALGVFAKFWSDENTLIRWIARECLDAFMSRLSQGERSSMLQYWRGYLPVQVPPELFSTKEVVRSVIILGKLLADDPVSYDESIKRPVALSAELLLNQNLPLYQDSAIETIGYAWSEFQGYFDSYEVIHILIRISSLPANRRVTLNRCFLDIASKNSPLLVSAIANNISHGSPSSAPTASLASSTLQSLAATSMTSIEIATHVIKEQPELWREFLKPLVEAVVKILDPNGGLRERVMASVSGMVEILVDKYDIIAFHRPTQKLAFSATPGSIMIYDLKTSNTAAVFSSAAQSSSSRSSLLPPSIAGRSISPHPGAQVLRNLVFSPDGKHLAAVELGMGDGGRLLVWRFVTGLLAGLISATTAADGGEGERVGPKRSVKFTQNDREQVKVEWPNEKKVEVTKRGELVVGVGV